MSVSGPTHAHVSARTVRSTIRERGSSSSARHCAALSDICKVRRYWAIRRWCPVRFTHESRFTLSTCGRCQKESADAGGERWAAWNVLQDEYFGSGTVMVWVVYVPDGLDSWMFFKKNRNR